MATPITDQKAPSKNNLQFKVRTIDGEGHGFNEPPDTTIAHLRTLCFERFRINPGARRWVFKMENGAILDNDAQTLAQAGVKDHSVLIFGTDDVLG